MTTAIKDEQWLMIPARIRAGYIKHAGTAQIMASKYPNDAYWVIRDDVLGDLRIKNAGFLETPAKMYAGVQKAVGGPNPITSSLLAGALGAGLGYGGGTLLENLFPERYLNRGRLRKNLALMGALGGAAIPALTWGAPAYARQGAKGLISGWPYRPEDQTGDTTVLGRSWAKEDWKTQPGADGKGGVPVDQATLQANQGIPKQGSITGAGGAFIPKIQRDAFNRAVLADPFMDQRLKGQAMGLASAASMARGRPMFAPVDVARVGASMLGGGIMGAAMGLMAGKVMSAFAGITPEAQRAVQKTGIMAGLLTAVVPRVYGQ